MCWAKGHQVFLSTRVEMLGISFRMLGTFLSGGPFLGDAWVASVQPVMTGPYPGFIVSFSAHY